MKHWFYKVSGALKFISLPKLMDLTQKRAIFPFYHAVSDSDLIHIKNLYKIKKTNEFERDLDFILKHYNPIDFELFKTRFEQNELGSRKEFLLTFDDGLREFYEVIAPILLRKGIPAVCFLNSGFVNNKDLFYRYKTSLIIEKLKENRISPSIHKAVNEKLNNKGNEENIASLLKIAYSIRYILDDLAFLLEIDFKEFLKENKPYLDTFQIESLVKKGFKFGAHSVDHPLFSTLTLDQQLSQLKQSIFEVTNLYDLDYRLFSFPFTDHGVSLDFFETVFKTKNGLADFTFGTAGIKNDSCLRNIQRIPMEVSNLSAEEIIKGQYLSYVAKSFVQKNVIIRK